MKITQGSVPTVSPLKANLSARMMCTAPSIVLMQQGMCYQIKLAETHTICKQPFASVL